MICREKEECEADRDRVGIFVEKVYLIGLSSFRVECLGCTSGVETHRQLNTRQKGLNSFVSAVMRFLNSQCLYKDFF